MQTDVNGCSTRIRGTEKHEAFFSGSREYVQYDYRTPDGELFSCVRRTIEECRAARNAWLKKLCLTCDTERSECETCVAHLFRG